MSGTIRNVLVVLSTGFGGFYYYKYKQLYNQVYGSKEVKKHHKEIEIHQEIINEEPIIVFERKDEEKVKDLVKENPKVQEKVEIIQEIPVKIQIVENVKEEPKFTEELPSATQRARNLFFDENNRIKRRLIF